MRVFTRRLFNRNIRVLQPRINNIIRLTPLESGGDKKLKSYTSLTLGILLAISETLGISEKFESKGIIDMMKKLGE